MSLNRTSPVCVGLLMVVACTWLGESTLAIAANAEGASIKDRFLAEYPAASKRLNRVYGNLQFDVVHTEEPYANGVVTRRYREQYATNGGRLLRKVHVEQVKQSDNDTIGLDRIYVADPRTSFSLQRAAPESPYVIVGIGSYEERAGGLLFEARPLTATFGYYETTLWQSVHNDVVTEWDVAEGGQGLAQVTWTEKKDETGFERRGKVIVAPSQSWAIREYSLLNYRGEPIRVVGALRGTAEYDGIEDGVPLVKLLTHWSEGYDERGGVKDRGNMEKFEVVSITRELLPESNFTLAAFGLRDPTAATANRPQWWLWLAVSGFALVLAGLGFGWLKGRSLS